MSIYNFERELFGALENVKASIVARPLNLGGVSASGGGAGGPPGGFIGYLPQTKVAYDFTESDITFTTSGESLLDNLNNIRYRITTLESGRGVVIESEGIVIASGITIIDFDSSFNVTTSGNAVTVECTVSGTGGGGGHTILDSGNAMPQRSQLDFIGENIQVEDDEPNDSTRIIIDHKGFYMIRHYIPSGTTVVIPSGYTMINGPEFELEGQLEIDGVFILEG